MKIFGKCELVSTHHHTVQCHIHCLKLFQHGFWQQGELKKEIAKTFYVQVKGCCSSTARSAEARIVNLLHLNQVNRCCSSIACCHATSAHNKSPYNICAQAHPKLFYNHRVIFKCHQRCHLCLLR